MAKKYDVSRFRTFYVSRLYNSTKFLVQCTPKELINVLGSVMDKGYYQAPIEINFMSGKIKQEKLSLKTLKAFDSSNVGGKLTAKGKKFAERVLNMKFKK